PCGCAERIKSSSFSRIMSIGLRPIGRIMAQQRDTPAMDFERAKRRLEGCYITVPTMFRDPDLELDLEATRRNVRFLIENGITEHYGTLLAGGAAGDFSTMSFEERIAVAEAVIAESDGRLPVAMGAQTTSTLELRRLAKTAATAGAEYIQVSCPFYFTHTEEDFFEHVAAAAEAADIG